MALTPVQVSRLASASPGQIAGAARRIGGRLASKSWLAPGNRYRVDVVNKLKTDAGSGGTIKRRQLAEYIAASAPLHCCDGWSFLGRAMVCHLHGDSYIARHLAYYAELRAALSLLSARGVGIFNQKHFAVNGDADAVVVSEAGTHRATWDVLEALSGLGPTAQFLGDLITPGGQSLHDWLAALPGGASWQPIAAEWLETLGVDLAVFGKDRGARNEASYRPTRLVDRQMISASEAAGLTCELWQMLEPSPNAPFAKIDEMFLRQTLDQAFYSVRGKSSRQLKAQFRADVDTAVSAGFDGSEADRWNRFLTRQVVPKDPRVIDLARNGRRLDSADFHVAVIARALLLLRIATGATQAMLLEASIDFNAMSFWWHQFGQTRGLWTSPPLAEDLTDGWADVQDAIDDLRSKPPASYWDMLRNSARTVVSLGNLDVVGLWGLAA